MKIIHIACVYIGSLTQKKGRKLPDEKPVVRTTTPSPYGTARVRTQKHRPETPSTTPTPAATAAQPTRRSE